MQTYFVDANVWLRFLVGDVEWQQEQAKKWISRSQTGEVRLVLFTEVVLEMVYVLWKQYKRSREEISEKITLLLSEPSIEVVDREVLLQAIKLFGETKLDLVDLLLYARSEEQGAQVLTFDEELKRLVG